MKLDEVQEILDITHVYPVVKSLLEKRVCFAWESLKEKYTVKKKISSGFIQIIKVKKRLPIC